MTTVSNGAAAAMAEVIVRKTRRPRWSRTQRGEEAASAVDMDRGEEGAEPSLEWDEKSVARWLRRPDQRVGRGAAASTWGAPAGGSVASKVRGHTRSTSALRATSSITCCLCMHRLTNHFQELLDRIMVSMRQRVPRRVLRPADGRTQAGGGRVRTA